MKRYKQIIAVFLMTAVFFCMAPGSSAIAAGNVHPGKLNTSTAAEDGSGADAAFNQVVVLYDDGEIPAGSSGSKTRRAKSDPAASAQESIIDQAIDGDFSVDDTIIIDAADEAAEDMVVGIISSDDYTAEQLAENLQDAEGIKYAEPNYRYTIDAVSDWNDTYIRDAWQLGENGLNTDLAPAGSAGGEPVVLAVMDTGIDYSHPDLEKRIWTAPEGFSLKGEHGIDWSDKDGDPMDENGHGTHCAGIIAAAADNNEGIAGVAGGASNVQLMGIRVLDSEGSGYLEDIVRGFKYLIRAKKEGVNIKAVNCSFGAGVTSDIFDEVIEQAGKAGILTIASAGNESVNNDSAVVSPANSKSDYVVSVAATDEDGGLSSYSNYGRKTVDIGAPGINILSSVSYYNYAPYLYDAKTVKETTGYYGEFAGASVEMDEVTGEESVTPVTGSDYYGEEITDVASFGASKMFSITEKDSAGHASLEITGGSEAGAFGIGNNQQSLRWKIDDAESGDQYILYFPYDKLKGEQYINMVFRTHTGEEESDGAGDLLFGDVKIDDVDSQGSISFSTSADETLYGVAVDPTWNSIWQASGVAGALYDRSVVKDLPEGMYGLGFVYNAMSDGDVYIDISSLAISRSDADESLFGFYDVYSGTSMAAPAVTGAAGLIAAARPDIDAETLKATLLGTTVPSPSLAGQCSTGGRLDFKAFSGEASEAKPSVSSVTADFSKGTVTIRGRGFGASPSLRAYRNAAEEGAGEISIKASDIKAAGETITISNAGYNGYDLIGSDIRFEITNGELGGEGSFYIVKGLTPYKDEFNTAYEEGEEFFIWDKTGVKASSEEAGTDSCDYGEEETPEDPVMPAGLSYITGADDLYKYNSSGDIYRLEYNESNGKYYPVIKGTPVGEMLKEYSEETAKKVDYWNPDTKEDGESLNYHLVAPPVYMGDVIYELICVDMVDRDAYVLTGLDLFDGADSWNVYYDSLAGLGKKPSDLNFRNIENATLAGYGGRLYMLGGNEKETYNEEDDTYSVEISKDFFSCEPDIKGTSWKYEGKLPQARTNGRAAVSNGKLFYFLTNDDEGLIDYSVYAFDGKTWTKAGELPKALFADADDAVITWIGDMLSIEWDTSDKILCAVDIDSKGIIFAGKSFDGPGDTFRFNTRTNKIEPIKYTLWETISDRKVDGAAMGSRFFVEYTKESTDEAIGKSFPIESGYVKLEKSVEGEGSGRVTGGGSYAKGNKSRISITPDKGSYVYSVRSKGFSPDLNKEYGKATAASKGTIASTYNAVANGFLEVYFGKISTRLIMPKKSIRKAVGKSSVEAYTDGTVSDVSWKSSNSKYAKVNKDGTISFNKAGVGKTVTLTASSVERPELKATCKVKIVSRERTKFTWKGRKLTTKTKVMIDQPLAKSKAPKKFKVKKKSGKAVLSWKKVKKASGYIVLRKTGKGRFKQISKLSAKKKTYTDKTVKKGKKYQYLVVSFKKVKGSKAIRISPASSVKKFSIKNKKNNTKSNKKSSKTKKKK